MGKKSKHLKEHLQSKNNKLIKGLFCFSLILICSCSSNDSDNSFQDYKRLEECNEELKQMNYVLQCRCDSLEIELTKYKNVLLEIKNRIQ